MNYDTEIQIHKNSIGSKTKLQESLLEAVQILHDGFIVNEKIPKTLECRIADDSKKDEGIYIVDYMNNKFEVSCFLDETFNVNDIVCVLVPDGDFAKTKIIIGSSDGSGEGANQVTQEQLNQAVTTLQTNFQAGVDAVGAACTRKGSPPASHSLEDTVAAIDAIQTGGNYGTLEVKEDGEYYPPPGIDAWNYVKVSKDVGEPHTVVFYGPEGNVIKTQTNVPYHGYANCTYLDGTTYQGQNFKGWNPPSSDIIRDTYCYPIYGDYIIDPGEIQEGWDEICIDGGAHCPIGGYRNLPITITVQPEEVLATVKRTNSNNGYWSRFLDTTVHVKNADSIIFQYVYYMVKVAEGEDGTNSTWISTGCASMPEILWLLKNEDNPSGYEVNTTTVNNYCIWDTAYQRTISCQDDWETCVVRQLLNGKILSSLPSVIQQTIKQVTKYSRGLTEHTPSGIRVQKSTLDKIWVPSVKELDTVMSVARYDGALFPRTYSELAEIDGIDYAANYTPIYTDGTAGYGEWWLRTAGYNGSSDCSVGVGWNNWGSGPELQMRYGHNQLRFPFGFCL